MNERYSTGSNLNTYSALIQNFYSQETAPHQAIHVAVNTGVEPGQEAGVKAFIRSAMCLHFSRHLLNHCLKFFSSPVGVFPKPENCVFVPVPVELRFHDAERSGRKLIVAHFSKCHDDDNSYKVDLLINTAKSSATSSQPISDLELIERAILDVADMMDRVLAYVRDVLSGQKKGDPAVGRYLMNALGASTDGLEKGAFNSSLQVWTLLLCSYVH